MITSDAEKPSPDDADHACGFPLICRPRWLQRFATARSFLIVYCLLGIIQTMSFMYFNITLTTLERRFKMRSGTTGWVLSGNEISQILLSLVLSYAGGTRHRPRWIAGGALMSALSCFILALPHFIFGAGEEALQLTREYVEGRSAAAAAVTNITAASSSAIVVPEMHSLCRWSSTPVEANATLFLTPRDFNAVELAEPEPYSIVPLVLIFASQFVLGIGTTMFYTLGTSYLDDGVPKSDTPMTLAYACTFRVFGMVLGFGLINVALRMYIDPWRTPLIDEHDPRWMGAWWFGWLLLGGGMLMTAVLIGMFPKVMPPAKQKQITTQKEQEHSNGNNGYRTVPLQEIHRKQSDVCPSIAVEDADVEDTFSVALMRLLRNKLLMYNNLANIFYILGNTISFTYIAKYMEVLFHRDSANATKISGPITILSMMIGFLLSGWLITRYRPATRKILMWNLVVGVFGLAGFASNLWLQCAPQSVIGSVPALRSIGTPCNQRCDCDAVPFSPVCDERTGRTYYSPCHAGCVEWSDAERVYGRCGCLEGLDDDEVYDERLNATTERSMKQSNGGDEERIDDLYRLIPGPCAAGCAGALLAYTIISCVINWLGASARISNILLSFRCV